MKHIISIFMLLLYFNSYVNAQMSYIKFDINCDYMLVPDSTTQFAKRSFYSPKNEPIWHLVSSVKGNKVLLDFLNKLITFEKGDSTYKYKIKNVRFINTDIANMDFEIKFEIDEIFLKNRISTVDAILYNEIFKNRNSTMLLINEVRYFRKYLLVFRDINL